MILEEVEEKKKDESKKIRLGLAARHTHNRMANVMKRQVVEMEAEKEKGMACKERESKSRPQRKKVRKEKRGALLKKSIDSSTCDLIPQMRMKQGKGTQAQCLDVSQRECDSNVSLSAFVVT